MEKLTVQTQNGQYDILLGEGLLQQAGALLCQALEVSRVAIVTDETVEALYGQTLRRSLAEAGVPHSTCVVPPGEASKCHEKLLCIYGHLLEQHVTRKDAILALGGGVMGDLAGYAAATYLRGIPLVQIPTTLLAQVDSSVGGKVAVDLPQGKNLVGAFHQPSLVIADTGTLRTLEPRQLWAGLAEVIKYGCIADHFLFEAMERTADQSSLWAQLPEWVRRSCAIKADYVQRDPYDFGVRRELNFGHTLGHALEVALGYAGLLHGEGVALGMVAAARLSEQMTGLPTGTADRIAALLMRWHLPVKPPKCDLQTVQCALQLDKKAMGDRINLVLLQELGQASIQPMERGAVEAWVQGVLA